MEKSIKSISDLISNKYSETFVEECFGIIQKLLNNILSDPDNGNKRLFKRTNEALKKKVLIIKESIDLLKAIGYTEKNEDFLEFKGDDFTLIIEATDVFAEVLKMTELKLLEQKKKEEEKRLEAVKAREEELKMKLLAEKLEKQKIKEQMKKDALERKTVEKPKDSIAKDIKFGANVCKFEPKRGG